MLKTGGLLVCALLLAAALIGGVIRLFELRFERGDIYPPYSTLRTDPLGASALYESLNRVPDVSARRYFERTFKEADGRNRTLMILGLEPYGLDLPRSEFNTVQQFAFAGGRVVMAYVPEVSLGWTNRAEEATDPITGKQIIKSKDNAKPAPSKTDPAAKKDSAADDQKKTGKPLKNNPDDDSDDDWRGMVDYASPEKEWGFHLTWQALTTNEDGGVEFPASRLAKPTAGLPPELVFHTGLWFDGLTNGWTTVYEHDHQPVVVGRRLGKGSLLLVADSYYYSNEAMLKHRETGLLAWTLGGGRDVIFDEAHLGVLADPGVASLMRKYHLHGLIFSLLLLAGLFVWKNSTSLVPPAETAGETAAPVAGKDAMAGFVNLLRRGIPRAEILARIFDEWQKTRHRSTLNPERRREIESLIQQEQTRPPGERQPLAVYRTISTLLRRRP